MPFSRGALDLMKPASCILRQGKCDAPGDTTHPCKGGYDVSFGG
jgi:hypothetical protein